MTQELDPAAPVPRRWDLARGGLLLAPSVGLSYGLHYAYNVVMAAMLGPAAFGALGALLALILLGSVPGIALQAVAARHTALLVAGGDQRVLWRRLLRLAGWWSVAVAAATIVAGPAGAAWLHLGSPLPMVMVALVLVSTPFSYLSQGVLQGQEAFLGYGVVGVTSALAKLACGFLLVTAGFGVSGAVAGAAIGTALAAAAGLVWVRRLAGARRAPGATPAPERLGPEMVTAVTGLLGLFLLTNLDVPLARHFLSADESGLYALGAVVAKIAFFGPQFVTTLIFARLVTAGDRRRLLAGSAAVIAGSGALLVVALAWLTGRGAALPLLGGDYASIRGTLPLFAILGSGLALAQLLLFEEIAAKARRMGLVLALAALAQATLISVAFHDSIGQIVGTGLAVTLVLLAAGLVLAWRRGLSARPPAPDGAPAPPAT
jgi:O-antigen/teichoic acid export membrane protein